MVRINGIKMTFPVPPVTDQVTDRPRCPKHCDVATPPESFGKDQYVCVCCGTQFTWKGPDPCRPSESPSSSSR